ncbi:MAG TPA: FTR1 family protein [Solirubrobacterales bacterium]|nr:FTR1 family protein [Solirubrobacterales bacterium]
MGAVTGRLSIRKAATLAVAAFLLLGAGAAHAADRDTAVKPWAAAEAIRTSLFDARSDLLLDGERSERAAAKARDALAGRFERDLARFAPAELRDLDGALDAADAAIAAADPVALATAYGTAVAALRHGAYEVTLAYTEREQPERAGEWLLIRDFRQATRYTRPGVDATTALDALAAGDLSAAEAVTQIRKDLLDAYQSRLVEYLDEAGTESERGSEPAVAESLAIASGYWRMLAPEYEEQRGGSEREAADAEFAALPGYAATPRQVPGAVSRAEALLNHFTAAPFTPEEQARRAQQLIRFIDLIPVEYDHGVSGTEVTIPFEITEAIAFVDAAQSALNDLSPELEELDPGGLADLEAVIDEIAAYLDDANEGVQVVELETIEDAHERATALIDETFPGPWKESSDEADFDLIEISLDQMEAAVAAGQPQTAEQARLTAYAFFEFGPEIKLKAFDPGLTTEIEGLMWYGARGFDGLASQIADGAGAREIRTTRLELDEALADARAKTGEGGSATTVITNSALIVFREGLEAILIIAAITASMLGTKRALRRPILRGALLAVPASIALFFVATLILDSLSQYGEKLEAVVGLIAIAVLLLVLNWFFHRVYWTEWIKGHRERSKELLAEGAGAAAGAAAGTMAGLYLLGFTSVFREGFETVLFLQSLQLSSGTGIVLGGVTLGLLATAIVGYATFALERKLPYKRLLIVTGVLIALVLIVLVGNTVRTLQGVGWLPITPIDVDLPLWMGTWLGIFPTVESLVAQAVAFAFVIGSYFAAEWIRKRNVRKAAAKWQRAYAEADGGVPGRPAAGARGEPGREPEPIAAGSGSGRS